MSGEQILLLVILAFVIGAFFYVIPDIREVFESWRDEQRLSRREATLMENLDGDSPFIHPEMRGNGAADRNSRGRKAASGSDPSHKHDIAHRDGGSTR